MVVFSCIRNELPDYVAPVLLLLYNGFNSILLWLLDHCPASSGTLWRSIRLKRPKFWSRGQRSLCIFVYCSLWRRRAGRRRTAIRVSLSWTSQFALIGPYVQQSSTDRPATMWPVNVLHLGQGLHVQLWASPGSAIAGDLHTYLSPLWVLILRRSGYLFFAFFAAYKTVCRQRCFSRIIKHCSTQGGWVLTEAQVRVVPRASSSCVASSQSCAIVALMSRPAAPRSLVWICTVWPTRTKERPSSWSRWWRTWSWVASTQGGSTRSVALPLVLLLGKSSQTWAAHFCIHNNPDCEDHVDPPAVCMEVYTIHTITGLIKEWLWELPEPLMTSVHYSAPVHATRKA